MNKLLPFLSGITIMFGGPSLNIETVQVIQSLWPNQDLVSLQMWSQIILILFGCLIAIGSIFLPDIETPKSQD